MSNNVNSSTNRDFESSSQRIEKLVNKHKQKQPTKEFYDELDVFVGLQVKSIEVFKRAVTIASKQGFNELQIRAFVQDYLKDKIPRTTLWRYLKKIEVVPVELLDFLTVPVEQATSKDPRVFKHVDNAEYNRIWDLIEEDWNKIKECLIEAAELVEKLGYNQRKIAIIILTSLKSKGMDKAGLEVAYSFLPDKYKPLRDFRKRGGTN